MQTPEGIKGSRAFIKRARNFIKYYHLRRKDPLSILINTINELKHQVESSQDLSELEPISKEVKMNGNYQNTKDLYQLEFVGEEKRVIVFKPSKFLETSEAGEIAYLVDIVVID